MKAIRHVVKKIRCLSDLSFSPPSCRRTLSHILVGLVRETGRVRSRNNAGRADPGEAARPLSLALDEARTPGSGGAVYPDAGCCLLAGWQNAEVTTPDYTRWEV